MVGYVGWAGVGWFAGLGGGRSGGECLRKRVFRPLPRGGEEHDTAQQLRREPTQGGGLAEAAVAAHRRREPVRGGEPRGLHGVGARWVGWVG